MIALLTPEEVADKTNEVLKLTTKLGRESEVSEFDYEEIHMDYSKAVTDVIFIMREILGAEAISPRGAAS